MDAVNMAKKGKHIQLGNGFVDLVLHGTGARCLEVCQTVIYCMCIFHGNAFCLPPSVEKRFWPVGEAKLFGQRSEGWRLNYMEQLRACNSNDRRNNPKWVTYGHTRSLPLARTGGVLNCHKFSLAFLSNPLSKTPRVCAFDEHNNKMRKKHILHGSHSGSCRRGG